MRLSAATLALIWLLTADANAGSDALEQGIRAFHDGRYEQAIELWRPLAEGGDAEAQLFLGYAFARGKGVGRDLGQSFAWYLEAARQGLPEAQYQVGLQYEVGEGVALDAAEAEYWYQRATAGGLCPGELSSSGRLMD
jgi:TPR repeat protein